MTSRGRSAEEADSTVDGGESARLVAARLRAARRAARRHGNQGLGSTLFMWVLAAVMAGLSATSWLANALSDPDLPS